MTIQVSIYRPRPFFTSIPTNNKNHLNSSARKIIRGLTKINSLHNYFISLKKTIISLKEAVKPSKNGMKTASTLKVLFFIPT